MNTTLEIPRTLGRRRAFASIMAAVSILLGCAWAGASAPTPAAALSCSMGPSLTPLAEANGIFCGGPESTGSGGFTGVGVTAGCTTPPDMSSLPGGFLNFTDNPSRWNLKVREGGREDYSAEYYKNGRRVGSIAFFKSSDRFMIFMANDTVPGYSQWATYECTSSGKFNFDISVLRDKAPGNPLAPGSEPTDLAGRVVTAASVTPLGTSGRSLVRVDVTNNGTVIESPRVTFDETAFEILDFPTLTSGAWCEQVGGTRTCTLPDVDPGATRTIVALVKPAAGAGMGPDSTILTVANSGMLKFSWGEFDAPVNHRVIVTNNYVLHMR